MYHIWYTCTCIPTRLSMSPSILLIRDNGNLGWSPLPPVCFLFVSLVKTHAELTRMADKRNKIFCFMKYFEEWLYIKWTSVICCTAIWEVQFVIKVKCFTLFIVWLLVYLFINVYMSLCLLCFIFICLSVSVCPLILQSPSIHS